MATAATVFQVVGAVVGVASAISQQRGARRERRARENAARVQNRQANLQRQRDIRRSVAASRVQRARAIAAGFSAGAPGASGVAQAAGGIQTDVASNIGASGAQFGLEQQRVGFLGDAAAAQSSQNRAATFGSFGAQISSFGTEQNLSAISNLFA